MMSSVRTHSNWNWLIGWKEQCISYTIRWFDGCVVDQYFLNSMFNYLATFAIHVINRYSIYEQRIPSISNNLWYQLNVPRYTNGLSCKIINHSILYCGSICIVKHTHTCLEKTKGIFITL